MTTKKTTTKKTDVATDEPVVTKAVATDIIPPYAPENEQPAQPEVPSEPCYSKKAFLRSRECKKYRDIIRYMVPDNICWTQAEMRQYIQDYLSTPLY